jgi:hypothetical protein
MLRWKTITLTTITFLVVAGIIFYLKNIGILGDLEALFLTIISALLSGMPSIIVYCFQPRVALKIDKIIFIEKQVNHNIGYYLKATILNEGKKIGLNINAYFEIKDSSRKPPPLLYIETETINGQRNVRAKEKPFDEHIGYVWILKGKDYCRGVLKELKHSEKVELLFPYNIFFFGVGKKWHEYEYLLKLEAKKEYEVKVTLKGEDWEKNTIETTKKVTIRV